MPPFFPQFWGEEGRGEPLNRITSLGSTVSDTTVSRTVILGHKYGHLAEVMGKVKRQVKSLGGVGSYTEPNSPTSQRSGPLSKCVGVFTAWSTAWHQRSSRIDESVSKPSVPFPAWTWCLQKDLDWFPPPAAATGLPLRSGHRERGQFSMGQLSSLSLLLPYLLNIWDVTVPWPRHTWGSADLITPRCVCSQNREPIILISVLTNKAWAKPMTHVHRLGEELHSS